MHTAMTCEEFLKRYPRRLLESLTIRSEGFDLYFFLKTRHGVRIITHASIAEGEPLHASVQEIDDGTMELNAVIDYPLLLAECPTDALYRLLHVLIGTRYEQESLLKRILAPKKEEP